MLNVNLQKNQTSLLPDSVVLQKTLCKAKLLRVRCCFFFSKGLQWGGGAAYWLTTPYKITKETTVQAPISSVYLSVFFPERFWLV